MTQDNIKYYKICVLTADQTDLNDTALQRQEVKKIFTNAKNLNFDLEHDHNFLSGIDPIENYIAQDTEKIADTLVPAGS